MRSEQGQFSVSIQALCDIFNLFLSIIRLGCDLINFSSSCNSSVLGPWIIKQPGNEHKLWWNNLEAGQRQCRCLLCCSWTMSQVVAAACEPSFLQADLCLCQGFDSKVLQKSSKSQCVALLPPNNLFTLWNLCMVCSGAVDMYFEFETHKHHFMHEFSVTSLLSSCRT